MTNRRSTKKALILSVLSLVVCLSMLIGTTFAWFTDSVTSANNIIKSGNLDVELYYQVEGQSDWTKVTAASNIFMEGALWEPGHTEVVKLKVVNEGTLALKYNLGVNIAGETGSVNAAGEAFKLSDFIKYGIVEGAQTYTRDQAIAAVDATATKLKSAYNSGTASLLPAAEKIVTMVVYMPTTVGNEANYATGAAQPTINLGINLFATQLENEQDSYGSDYDKDAMTFVKDAAEAQAALDNAVAGDIIKLAPGVNYGKLAFRANPGNSNTTLEDVADAWKYNYNRTIENITIIGAEGAKVDAIVFETGAQPGDCNNRATVKNLVVDGVEFTAALAASSAGYNAPIFITTSNATVDGLTVKNCKLIGDNSKLNLVYLYGADGAKNITLSGNTVDGVARLCELRGTENVTITNNTIKNTYEHGMLLAGGNYSGNVTITGNTASGINDRFVRMAGAGDAVVVIKDNNIVNYMGEDADYIKVTDGNNVTIENNNLIYGFSVANDVELAAAINAIQTNGVFQNKEVTITMAAGEYSGDHVINQYPQWNGNVGAGGSANNYGAGVPVGAPITKIVFWGQAGATFTGNVTVNGFGNAGTGFASATATTTFKNVTFDGANSVEANGEDYAVVYLKAAANNVTFEGCTFQNATHVLLGTESGANGVGRIDVNNCLFNDGGCLSGYFETLNVTNTNVTAAKNGFINKSKAGNVTVTGGTINAGKYFLRTSNSGINMTVTGATITLYESDGTANLVKFRGSAESATFAGCTLPATYATEGVDANSILTIQ